MTSTDAAAPASGTEVGSATEPTAAAAAAKGGEAPEAPLGGKKGKRAAKSAASTRKSGQRQAWVARPPTPSRMVIEQRLRLQHQLRDVMGVSVETTGVEHCYQVCSSCGCSSP